MALRVISRTAEEQNALIDRFRLAQDGDEGLDEIDKRLETQRDFRDAVLRAATILDVDIADSREKSLALTHLEEALLWAGKVIFS